MSLSIQVQKSFIVLKYIIVYFELYCTNIYLQTNLQITFEKEKNRTNSHKP